ncbi:helix-turn-helix transcriptional regulator [Dankookia sp. GCM10030260]|uniref:helix-turn-helix transcriptional regulator n=1 Tax=Dankookia sp. GCM10030260 TaxID=3273390 RepID=UPI0036215077
MSVRVSQKFADGERHRRHLQQLELALRWNLSPRTLERWRWLGKGPAYLKLGGRVAYRLEDVEAHETAQRRGGAR